MAVVILDGHGLDARRQHQTGSHSEQWGVVPPLHSANQVVGGLRDAGGRGTGGRDAGGRGAARPRCRIGQSRGYRSEAVQKGDGCEAPKEVAPAQASAPNALMELDRSTVLGSDGDAVHGGLLSRVRTSHAGSPDTLGRFIGTPGLS